MENHNISNVLWRKSGCEAHAIVEPPDAPVSFAASTEAAARIAQFLIESGINPGDRVPICLERGPEAVAAYFGVMAAGAVAIIVHDALRPRQIEAILDDSQAAMMLTSARVLGRMHRSLITSTPIIDVSELRLRRSLSSPLAIELDGPAQIIYTSGSTGLPKGVILSHQNLLANIRIVAEYLGLQDQDRTLSLLPFSSVFGINQLLCSVATGGTLIIERSPLPTKMVATMRETGATVVAAVPPLWSQLLSAPDFKTPAPRLRNMQSAGGYLPVPTVRALRGAQPHASLYIMYGMTEVMRSTYLPPAEVDRRPNSMGRAMAETEILVVRQDGSECDIDEPGELVHSGPTVGLGYWRRPEDTVRTFRAHPSDPTRRAVFSGDIVRRDAQGYLYFVSRNDRLIKTLGYRLGPDEVTDVLLASGLVTDAAVTTAPDPVRGERILAHMVLAPKASAQAVRNYCRLEMPRWMQPAQFMVWTALPRLPGGKYDVHQLRNPLPGSVVEVESL